MLIKYDDLAEFAEVRIRCANTREKGKCKYCPFYDRCQIDDNENLHVMCCEIEYLPSPRNRVHGVSGDMNTLDVDPFDGGQGIR